jgi:hypothetical protein
MNTLRFSLALLALPLVADAQMPVTDPEAAPAETAPATEAKWSDIQDLTYEKRADFMAGLSLLQKRLERQLAGLKTKRENLPATEDPEAFDFNLEVLRTARTRFLSASTDIGKATPENWNQLKERVGSAWEKVQDSYDKTAGKTL